MFYTFTKKMKTNETLFVERQRAYQPRAHIFLKHFNNEEVESFPTRNGKIRTVAACLNWLHITYNQLINCTRLVSSLSILKLYMSIINIKKQHKTSKCIYKHVQAASKSCTFIKCQLQDPVNKVVFFIYSLHKRVTLFIIDRHLVHYWTGS